jgi:hypothetical protein
MALKKIRVGDTTYDISGGASISVTNNQILTINNNGSQTITDLTNTIWTLNPNAEGIELYYSNNADDYSKISYESPEDRTIIILGGEDVTNKDLIAYLQSNATFVGFNSTSFGTITQIVVDNKPYDLGGSGSGSGVEIIDITGLDTIPEEFQDIEKLKTCYLKDNELVFHLSFIEGTDLYYGCFDDLVYTSIGVSGSFEITRRENYQNISVATQDYVNNATDALNTTINKSINTLSQNLTATQDYIEDSVDPKITELSNAHSVINQSINTLAREVSTKQNQLAAGRNIVIEEDGTIGIANPNNCKVVAELPELTPELAKEETIYSYEGKLYNVLYDTAMVEHNDLRLINSYQALPYKLNGMSAAAVGDNIYILGGYSPDVGTSDKPIYQFNTITKSVTEVPGSP